ncbi:hypothetical protein [Acinetobacter sp.]|jgi:hypothetical protein|uniref:hypothetical protein n=1 Tax=Acinetobacter sp. TaxID=472 RepID=UPI002828A12D|nr:hypothetical protein [Acinetobacter sp.]MDR2248014.1 hypothetical protein [Acinetobacter sp.]
MKNLFRRSLTAFMCVGALMAGAQSWAGDAKPTTATNAEMKINSKAQEKCSKPCSIKSGKKMKQDHMQHEHGNMADMSQMGHSKMSEMDHSQMMNMDHSKMMNMDHSKMGDMDHSKMMNMSDK